MPNLILGGTIPQNTYFGFSFSASCVMGTTSVLLHILYTFTQMGNTKSRFEHTHEHTTDAFIARFIKIFCPYLWNNADVP